MNGRMHLCVYYEIVGGPEAEGHGLGDAEAAGQPEGAGGPMAAGTEVHTRHLNPIKRWVADTGCGYDLLPKVVQTANLPVTGVADGGCCFSYGQW